MRFLLLILGSVVLGFVIAPGSALPGNRLSGTIWPIPPTQVAHYAAVFGGLTILLWMCRLISGRRTLLMFLPSFGILVLSHTRTALLAMIIALLIAGFSLVLAKRRVRKFLMAVFVVIVIVVIPMSPLLTHWLSRGESNQELVNLTGRTEAWSGVLSHHRPLTNVLFGDGLSNDSVIGSPNPEQDGLPIDSSWISIYQDQGIVGEVLVGASCLILLLTALYWARGPTRALALYLIVYCLIAGINDRGLGNPSQYLMDLTVAASLLTLPSALSTELTFGLKLPCAGA
jgi:hypothetical protein